MDPSVVLINVSQLLQMLVVVGEGMKLQRGAWQVLVSCLRMVERVVEEVRRCEEMDLEMVLKLEAALLHAKAVVMENPGVKTSRVFNVVWCEQICSWFQEIAKTLDETLCNSCFESLSQVGPAVQLLRRSKFLPDISDQILLSETEVLLVEMRENQHVRAEKLVKLFDKLEIVSDEALTRELDALEAVKEQARLGKRKSDEEFFERVISLLMQMVKCSPEGLQVKSEARGLAVPADFRCPLSLELMGDPVIIASGQTYERVYIQQWLDQGNTTCPKTRQVLAHTNLIPNYTVKALITNWCESNGVPLPTPAKLSSSIVLRKFSRQGDAARSRSNGVEEATVGPAAVDDSGDDVSFVSSRASPRSVRTVRAQSFAGSRGDDWSFVPKKESSGLSRLSRLRASPSGSSSSEEGRHGELQEQPRTPGTVISIDASINLSDYSPYNSDASAEFRSPSPVSYERHSFPSLLRSARKQRQQQQQQQHLLRKASSARSITDGALRILIENSVEDLGSDNLELQLIAAEELRLLAKYDPENRILIASAGAIGPLVRLVSSSEKSIQENAVTALLNLSINDRNKSEIVTTGAIDPLVEVLKSGTAVARENAAATLFTLSVLDENKPIIGSSGAIPPLVDLLVNGSLRGQKDAATALFNLSLYTENKVRLVTADVVKALVNLMKEPTSGMVDKAVAILANLMTVPEGRVAVGDDGGIPALVEVVEAGSARGKENAAAALLHLCTNSPRHRSMVLQEGAIPPLHALSQTGTPRAKEKASALLRHFREQRHASFGSSRSGSQQF